MRGCGSLFHTSESHEALIWLQREPRQRLTPEEIQLIEKFDADERAQNKDQEKELELELDDLLAIKVQAEGLKLGKRA